MNNKVMYDEVYLPLNQWMELGQYLNDKTWGMGKFTKYQIQCIRIGQGIEFDINGKFYQGPTYYYLKE